MWRLPGLFMSFLLTWCFCVVVARYLWRRYPYSGHRWLSLWRERRWVFGIWFVASAVAAGALWLWWSSPLLGALALLCAPLGARACFSAWEEWNRTRLERSSLAVFTLLRVLVGDGEALPQALFRVARALQCPFAVHLRRSLRGFENGSTLSECLFQFEARHPGGTAVYWMVILDQAYREGLPVMSLLNRACLLLEAESAALARVRRATRWAYGQAFVAAGLPWSLFGVYSVFQPDLMLHFWLESLAPACVVVAAGMQLGGGLTLWKFARFY